MKTKLLFTAITSAAIVQALGADVSVSIIERPEASGKIDYYVANRAPLAPSPVAKLPVGAVRPKAG